MLIAFLACSQPDETWATGQLPTSSDTSSDTGESAYASAQFSADLSAGICALYATCDYLSSIGYADEAACVAGESAYIEGTLESCDYFDGDQAQACTIGVSAMTCDDLSDGSWPSSCSAYCVDWE